MTETPALLTADDVVRLVADRDQAAERLAELDRRVEAVRLLLGDKRFEEIAGRNRPAEGRSFREVMEEALSEAPHGLTYDQLREALQAGGLGETLERSPNNFFNTIARLQRLEVADKIGNRLVLRRFAEQMPDDVRRAVEAETPDQEGTPALILQVLRDAGRPMAAGEIVAQVTKIDSSLNASNRVYAALSRMAKRGAELSRLNDGRYRLVSQQGDEPVLPSDLF